MLVTAQILGMNNSNKWKFLEGYLHCGNFPIVLFTNQSGEVDHKMSSDALLLFPSRGGAHFLILSILTGLVTWVDQTTVKVALCRFRAQAGSITSISYCFGNSATVWKNHRCRLQEGSPCEGKQWYHANPIAYIQMPKWAHLRSVAFGPDQYTCPAELSPNYWDPEFWTEVLF